MRNFQDTFETRKRLFISAFLICMTVPLNQWPQICLFAKFRDRIIIPKFGTKNNFLGSFGPEFYKLLSYLKSTSLNLSGMSF